MYYLLIYFRMAPLLFSKPLKRTIGANSCKRKILSLPKLQKLRFLVPVHPKFSFCYRTSFDSRMLKHSIYRTFVFLFNFTVFSIRLQSYIESQARAIVAAGIGRIFVVAIRRGIVRARIVKIATSNNTTAGVARLNCPLIYISC